MKTHPVFAIAAALLLGLISPPSNLVASDSLPRIGADDREALNEHVGHEVLVTGTVRRMGTTDDGGIVFLNFAGPKDNGFVAVIFRQYQSAFPHGFSEYVGKEVTIRGVLEMFRNQQPQIRVESPDQIFFTNEVRGE